MQGIPRLTTAAFNVLDTDAFNEIVNDRANKILSEIYLFTSHDEDFMDYLSRGADVECAIEKLLKDDKFIRDFVYFDLSSDDVNTDIAETRDPLTKEWIDLSRYEYERRIKEHIEKIGTDIDYTEKMIAELKYYYNIVRILDMRMAM